MRVALGREYRGHRVQQGPVVHRAFEGQSGLEARLEAFRLARLDGHTGLIPFYLMSVYPGSCEIPSARRRGDGFRISQMMRWRDLCRVGLMSALRR